MFDTTCILMLHRIAPINSMGIASNENLKVSPEFLDSFICNAKKKAYTFISLDELVSIKNNTRSLRKCLCITLDDGYADNYDNGLDITKQHNIPFAIYISTSLIDKKAHLWWFELEHMLLTHDSLFIKEIEYPCANVDSKNKLFLQLRSQLLSWKQEVFNTNYETLFSAYLQKTRQAVAQQQYALTWEQIALLDKEPLCTIASHTHTHRSLKTLSASDMKNDIIEGKQNLEIFLNHPVEHFAFPFGTPNEVSKRELTFVKTMQGIKTATTTDYGFITKKTSLYRLPRIALTESFNYNAFSILKQIKWAIKEQLR